MADRRPRKTTTSPIFSIQDIRSFVLLVSLQPVFRFHVRLGQCKFCRSCSSMLGVLSAFCSDVVAEVLLWVWQPQLKGILGLI